MICLKFPNSKKKSDILKLARKKKWKKSLTSREGGDAQCVVDFFKMSHSFGPRSSQARLWKFRWSEIAQPCVPLPCHSPSIWFFNLVQLAGSNKQVWLWHIRTFFVLAFFSISFLPSSSSSFTRHIARYLIKKMVLHVNVCEVQRKSWLAK